MALRIEVSSKVPDSRANKYTSHLQAIFPDLTIENVQVIDVYTIDKDFQDFEITQISNALINPLIQAASLKNTQINKAQYAIEIGFLPGVTDNVAHTTKEIIEDLLKINFKDSENVYTSQLIFFQTNAKKNQINQIASSLINPIIQRVHIKDSDQYNKDQGMDLIVPKVKLKTTPQVTEVDLNISDEELIKIGKEGIANKDKTRRGPLALDLLYMKAIQKYFKNLKRNPTDIELESLAQTWSEHCKHTIFASPMDDDVPEGLYKTYIKKATEKIRKQKGDQDFCVSVFTDNSGAIAFDDHYLITHKVETHNTPSALDPFGGAITGIVGVNRDALGFGMGAKPILNTYGFCFADPSDEKPLYKDSKLTTSMLSPKRIMDGVIAGVNSGGNQSGIPTTQGFLYFNDRYKGKPLVFVGTLGLIQREINGKKAWQKKAKVGDLIVMVGGRVGLDGIHGATFSSEALDSGSPSTAVQIGDPITQKKFSDAIAKEAVFQNLYNSITDNGAGGLSCSVAEMAREAGGARVYLENVPLKYPGLDPWQIWISESQERMTLAVPENKWPDLANLFDQRGVEANVIGEFTNSGQCEVIYQNKQILNIDLNFLHDGLPERKLISKWTKPEFTDPIVPSLSDYNQVAQDLVKRLNITSFEFISTQYDHEVQSMTVLKPLQGRGRINGEASVIKPIADSTKGVAVSQALYPSYSEIDPYLMALNTVDSAIRNLVVVGADPERIALLDNFCWCSSFEEQRLGELKLAAQGCFDGAVGFGAPFISGKDSMFNDFKGFDDQGKPVKISVPPTLVISSVSVMDNVENVVSMDAKMPGDLVYLLGETINELGGSEYYQYLSEKSQTFAPGNSLPTVDIEQNKKLYQGLYGAISQGLIASSVIVTRGGLLIALVKKSLSGKLGLEINLAPHSGNNQELLFSESSGRVVVTVAPQFKDKFEEVLKGLTVYQIGQVTQNKKLKIKSVQGKTIVDLSLDQLTASYKSTFKVNTSQHKPTAGVLTGYGINCEEETKTAFEKVGGAAEIVHINDLIANKKLLKKFQILAIPGGFSYGDDTGSGNGFANKLKNNVWEDLERFIQLDRLVIGICNGCQVLANLGLFPAIEKKYGEKQVAILHNDNATYTDRWVDLKAEGNSPWVKDVDTFSCPIAHGEGKFYAEDATLEIINQKGLVALRYTKGEMCNYLNLPANPNGAVEDIAGITDETGRILGLMPHPERAMFFTQLPNWPLIKEQLKRAEKDLPKEGPGLQIFKNGVNYFK
jgi:phosphoribosylformylglycinamidine synthase